MSRILLLFCLIAPGYPCEAQETILNGEAERQLEAVAEKLETEDTDDSLLEEMDRASRNPLNLNRAGPEDLKALHLLTDLQIGNFILYRKVLGPFIHIYELQAVPGWDVWTIRRMLPFVSVAESQWAAMKKSIREGEHKFVVRQGRQLEKGRGYRDGSYHGSSDKMMLRYRYVSGSRLSYGITAEKDAGESVFGKTQPAGFDFYSFHFFLREAGKVESIAIGDYTINMGQGLIHYQHLAFKKTAAVLNVKRQSPVLKPYTSAGEFNFLRGAAISLRKGRSAASFFFSRKKLSANLQRDAVNGTTEIASFLNSGLHRTATELARKRNVTQLSAGAIIRLTYPNGQVSFNAIYHRFSNPIQKADDPYDFYGLNGLSFFNGSIDYSYTVKNLHLFGETAFGKHKSIASVHGLLISLHQTVDAVIVHRHIPPSFQAVNGNASTENSSPNNEVGWYVGISFKPQSSLSLDAYVDVFRFPWLKYRVNAPSAGKDYLVNLQYRPGKKVHLYSLIRSDFKDANYSSGNTRIPYLELHKRLSWRTHLSVQLSETVAVQNRFELISFRAPAGARNEGTMFYVNLSYKAPFSKWSSEGRWLLFAADSYSARIYAYENRLPFLSSIPSFYGKGMRYLLSVNRKFASGRKTAWKLLSSLSWSQTIYADKEVIGTGGDEINDNKQSEYGLQFILSK